VERILQQYYLSQAKRSGNERSSSLQMNVQNKKKKSTVKPGEFKSNQKKLFWTLKMILYLHEFFPFILELARRLSKEHQFHTKSFSIKFTNFPNPLSATVLCEKELTETVSEFPVLSPFVLWNRTPPEYPGRLLSVSKSLS